MKLLQEVSIKNHSQNSNVGQNGDLVKFERSKCVHVSNLKIFGSRVFYKFRGFHRLPIYDFRIIREKDMNYLVLICKLYHLIFTSIICTVTM
jgi:hypothetical protein